MADPPSISILMPVFDPSPDYLRAAIKSVTQQFYPNWELCIADCSLVDPGVAAVLKRARLSDARIKVVRTDRSNALLPPVGVAMGLGGGSFIALLDHDAVLSPNALFDVAVAIAAQPAVDIIYSDEDKIDASGCRSMPYFKAGWNPELMLGQNLIGRFAVFRRALVDATGGFRAGLNGSEDYDLGLRAAAATSADRIVHIPRVLYHGRQADGGRAWTGAEPDARSSDNRRVVSEFLAQAASAGQAVASVPVWGRQIYPVPEPAPLVSVIIPTRDHADMLARVMAGLLRRTDYPSLDVIVVDNGSVEPDALALLEQFALDDRVTVLRRPGPFNYSVLNNEAVRRAKGELILLLNNDIDVIDPGWLREMVSHAVRPGIGAVGAKLLFPNETIQHGGITVGMYGLADHQYLNAPRDDPGYFNHLKLARNITAVTAACLLVRRQAFQEVGGLNEDSLPVEFNDVDLCLKLAARGYRNLWTPHAELYHLESASRGYGHSPEKAVRLNRGYAYIRQQWGYMLDHDPCWSPNLSLYTNGIALAFPPRLGPQAGGLPVSAAVADPAMA